MLHSSSRRVLAFWGRPDEALANRQNFRDAFDQQAGRSTAYLDGLSSIATISRRSMISLAVPLMFESFTALSAAVAATTGATMAT
jgi:hypothetical protein